MTASKEPMAPALIAFAKFALIRVGLMTKARAIPTASAIMSAQLFIVPTTPILTILYGA